MIDSLAQLPDGLEFQTVHEVWVALAEPGLRDADALRDRARHEPLSEADE